MIKMLNDKKQVQNLVHFKFLGYGEIEKQYEPNPNEPNSN